jgi:hypothetical protein
MIEPGGEVVGMAGDEDQFLEALYEGAADPAELGRALDIISDRMKCRSAALISLDVRTPFADVALMTGVFDDNARVRYLKDFAANRSRAGRVRTVAARNGVDKRPDSLGRGAQTRRLRQ